MNKIQINSIEAVILFVLYICAQDNVITEEELEELMLELPLLQKLYFDLYGEFIDEDLVLLSKNMTKKLITHHKLISPKISKDEKELFSRLLTDPKLQDVALMSARHASADRLYKLGKNYYYRSLGFIKASIYKK